ncbi:MAG: hypothetical protein IJZ68_01125 [Bacteroidaceae bacterium]|nr:hypothetical protein [Bacteroidaceae bacterium]
MEDLLKFKRFPIDFDEEFVEICNRGAIEKLQTLYPGKKITSYDNITLGVETDSLYSDTGVDVYELGLVDGELLAMRCVRTDEVVTFRQ